MQQSILKINKNIQNDMHEVSIVDVISDTAVASDLRHVNSSEFYLGQYRGFKQHR